MKEEKIISEPEDIIFEKEYYNIEYPGQDLFKKESFKKWFSFHSEKIRIENELRFESNKNKINEFFIEENIMINAKPFLFISLCKSCQCYSIHSLQENSIFAKCYKCQKEYCIGCFTENYSSDKNQICFRGYFKMLYLRIKNEKGKELEFGILEYLFLFMITIIIMPIYLPLISSFSVFNRHPYKPIDEKNNRESFRCFDLYAIFFPIFYSILYFVYVISFLPLLFFITLIIFLIPFLRKKFLIIYEPIIG